MGTTNKTFRKMSAERISIRKRYDNSKAPHSYGVSRRQEQSPPWHRRPAGGIRRYQRFRTPSDADSQTYEHEFISREDDFVAERRSRGSCSNTRGFRMPMSYYEGTNQSWQCCARLFS